MFEELFPETRFNSWSVGELHVIDPRIIPNGRRDHFEQNVHFHNLLTHLTPVARDITHRCRTSSIQRKWSRDFELREMAVREKAAIIKQGAVAGVTDIGSQKRSRPDRLPPGNHNEGNPAGYANRASQEAQGEVGT